jgi:N-acetylglucosamine malate deacetylase 1
MKRVLVLSPHPDDETIGCGGSLRRHRRAGDDVHVVFLTSGEQGGHGRSPEETIALREREARAAARVLGIRHLEFWHLPDGALRTTVPAIRRLRAVLLSLRPDVIYVPHPHESHPDHRAAYRLVRRALAHRRGGAPEVLMYEVWTPLQRLDAIVDISDDVDVKLRALRKYRSQCAVVGFDAAVKGLNRYRGELHSWPGGDYAEVFERLRR